MGNLQSNPSSSTQTIEKRYEVFLNFRGIDTRYGFTNTLYEALRAKSIEAFMDEPGLKKGDKIGLNLLKTIRDSKISVVIFSKNYASSKWCLRELVEIMECEEKHGQTVIPVFYNVAVSDVDDLKGSFKDGFDQLKKKFDEKLAKDKAASIDSADRESCMASFDESEKEFLQEMKHWRDALTKATRVNGWESSETRPETKLVDEIVKHISETLMRAYIPTPCDFRGLYGFEERFEKVMSLLCLHNTDIRIIGIWGMGGIGKSTIADKIFHQISDDEYGKCFIQKVRQRLEQCGGLVSVLQQEVLSQVLNDRDIKLHTPTLPQHIKERLCRKKVFIVLDDVDDFLTVQNLAGGLDRLGPGSRIILTSRNRDVLERCEVIDRYIYKVPKLSNEKARQFFCEHAFKQQIQTKDLIALSDELLCAIEGNPLGVKVVSSALSILNKDQWQSALSRLKKSSEILGVLQISYDGLEDEDKHIFLDIACFYVGLHQNYVAEILGDCSYSLKVLSDRSLITISDIKTIEMHDLLQEMGREIVFKECPRNPSNRSRLWTQEDVLDILKNGDGTDAIRGIFLNMYGMNGEQLSSQAFEKMKNLRFLKFYDYTFHWFEEYSFEEYSCNLRFANDPSFEEYNCNLRFANHPSYLSDKLRSLYWDGYPFKALPSNFVPKNLVELNLRHSNLEKLCENTMHAPKLKWITFTTCPYLSKVSDHLDAPLLEKIDIQNCQNLLVFPSPVHEFNKLRKLRLRYCTKFQSFPSDIQFPSLISLDLYGCTNLNKISNVLDAPLLTFLDVGNCKNLLGFPSLVHDLNNLCELNLDNCKNLQRFPSNKIHFPSLIQLDFKGCIKFKEFPHISGKIERLSMRKTAIQEVPLSIQNLTELDILDLQGCTKLKNISTNICKLKALKELCLSRCSTLECFPEILETMSSLKILDLSGTAIKGLHHSIENLSGLEVLRLKGCENIHEVPPSIVNLTGLVELDLKGCTGLKNISTSIFKFKALKKLCLSSCSALKCFPEILETVESLKILDLSRTAIKGLHHSIENLSGLEVLWLEECENLEMLPISIFNLSSLSSLILSGCSKLENLSGNSMTDLSNYGESATTKLPICSRRFQAYFTNCLKLNKTAIINMMELLIKQHRYLTTKGCATQAIDLKFAYSGSEAPGWLGPLIAGSSTNIQISGHLIGLALCAVIEFYDEGHDDGGHYDGGHDDESDDEESDDDEGDGYFGAVINYEYSCACQDGDLWLNCLFIRRRESRDATLIDPNQIALSYDNASKLKLCSECTNCEFKFSLDKKWSRSCKVTYCGVCPVYEEHSKTLLRIADQTCAAADQDFGGTSIKEQGKIRKFSDEAETSGRSNEDEIDPHPKRTCR